MRATSTRSAGRAPADPRRLPALRRRRRRGPLPVRDAARAVPRLRQGLLRRPGAGVPRPRAGQRGAHAARARRRGRRRRSRTGARDQAPGEGQRRRGDVARSATATATLALGYLHRTVLGARRHRRDRRPRAPWSTSCPGDGRRARSRSRSARAGARRAAASSPTASRPTSSPAIRTRSTSRLASGAIVVGLREQGAPGSHRRARRAVADHRGRSRPDGRAVGRRRADLTLLGAARPRRRARSAARAAPGRAAVLAASVRDRRDLRRSAPRRRPRPFDAIIGADALAGDALRLRLGDDEIFVLADIGGNEQRSHARVRCACSRRRIAAAARS